MKTDTRYVVCSVVTLLLCASSANAALVLHWTGEMAGANFADDSGNGNVGEIYNSVPSVPGLVGNAMQFSGDDNLVQNWNCTGLPSLATDSWSMNAYIKPDEVIPNWAQIFNFGSANYDTQNRGLIGYNASAEVRFVSSNVGDDQLETGKLWKVGVWQMMTITCDGTNITVYKDGEVIGSELYNAGAGTITLADGGTIATVNRGPWGQRIKGLVDEFAIWDNALTPAEIETLAAVVPQSATLVLHWTGEMDGVNFADESGNGNVGEIYNTVTSVPGLVGNAMQFPGGDNLVQNWNCLGLPSLATDSWSMNAYIKLDEAMPDWTQIFNFGSADYDTQNRGLISFGTPSEILFASSYAGDDLLETGESWETNVWQMMTITCDGTDITVYKNGELIGSESYNAGAGTITLADGGLIAAVNRSPWGHRITGFVDEFKIWDGALVQSEINTLASALPHPEIFVEIAPGTGGVDLTWNTVSGINYLLLEKTDLTNAGWSTNQSGIAGTKTNVTVTVFDASNEAFFKAAVEQ